jgi:hypothetical protein
LLRQSLCSGCAVAVFVIGIYESAASFSENLNLFDNIFLY